jgi:hypothetical protein
LLDTDKVQQEERMANSSLQEPFMREVAASFHATRRRILRQVEQAPDELKTIVENELRGLYHGLFVILDGGSALADQGLVHVTDDDGVVFDRFLHEISLAVWTSASEESS